MILINFKITTGCLINLGHSVIVIEHQPDIIKSADYIIDTSRCWKTRWRSGFAGTPEDLAKDKFLERRSLLLKNCNKMPILPSEYQPKKNLQKWRFFYDL